MFINNKIIKLALMVFLVSVVHINNSQAKSFYIGSYVGLDNNGYKEITETKSGSFMSGFLGYEFQYLDVELGYNYRLHKDLSTRFQMISYNSSDFYIELAPKYNINHKNSLLLLTSVAQLNKEIHTHQGVVENGALEGDIAPSTNNVDKQSNFMYSFGLGYIYKLNNSFSLSLKYKYNMPTELESYSSASLGVRFFLL